MSDTVYDSAFEPEAPLEVLEIAREVDLLEDKARMSPSAFKEHLSEYMSATNDTMLPEYQNHIRNSDPKQLMTISPELRLMVWNFVVGPEIYASSTVYDGPVRDDWPDESVEFAKDWDYYKKPEGMLKHLLRVSSAVRADIIKYVLPTRVFKFGDVTGFLSWLDRPILMRNQIMQHIRKVNIMVFREGACLLPMGDVLALLATDYGEQIMGMSLEEERAFANGLSLLRVEQFKLTVRDGLSLPQHAKLRNYRSTELYDDMAADITADNYPLRFWKRSEKQIVVEFGNDLVQGGKSWFFPIEAASEDEAAA